MNLDLEMAVPEPVPTAENPYALGWRYTRDPDAEDWRVPLTEDDLVFPQEDDFVVNNQAHDDDRFYLTAVFRRRIEGRPELRLLSDHLIDFQHPSLSKYLGPDLILFNGEARPWDKGEAVFPVEDMKARPLFVVEITSPSTRRMDLTRKMHLFYLVGVPLYVLIDLPTGGGRNPVGIVAFQAGPAAYERLPSEPDGRVWLEVVEVFLAVEDDHVVCYDRVGTRIPNYAELTRDRDDAHRRAAEAEARAVAAAARMSNAEARAAAEAAEVQRLRDELAALRARLSGNTEPPTGTPNS
jgi:Uma2 family endonuclease